MTNLIQFVDTIFNNGGASSKYTSPKRDGADFRIKLFGCAVTQRILITSMITEFIRDNETSDISAWIDKGYLNISVE